MMMATVSFTREMKLDKEETERLLDILERKTKKKKFNKVNVKKASQKTITKVFGEGNK